MGIAGAAGVAGQKPSRGELDGPARACVHAPISGMGTRPGGRGRRLCNTLRVRPRGPVVTDLLTPTPDTRRNARRGRRGLQVTAVVVLLLVAVGFMRWRSSLNVVSANAVSVYGQSGSAPIHVGETYYIDAGLGPVPDGTDSPAPSVRVTLDAVSAGAELWTTEATSGTTITGIEVATVICLRKPNSVGVGIALPADLAASCSAVRPLALPETLDLGFTTTQVLYKVAVATPGTYKAFGISVEYHQGVQHGAVRGSTDLTLTATR